MPRYVASLVLTALVLCSCGSPQRPVDTSQAVMLQLGAVLHEADLIVARVVDAERDTIVSAVHARRLECSGSEDLDGCLTDLAIAESARTERLVEHLEAVYFALRAWERANDAWRDGGTRPTSWNEAVCLPLSDALDALLIALRARGVDVPPTWSAIISQADIVCSMGAIALEGAQ